MLTRDFRETFIEEIKRDSAFGKALLAEANELLLNGEPELSRRILRDLVNATVGFEALATATNKPSKSLHRMLSPRGNPSMDNLSAIFGVLSKSLQQPRTRAQAR
jgi:DNA-binding phage protein